EPTDLFEESLPPSYAARMPHSVKDLESGWETIHVDGQEFRRRIPKPSTQLTDDQGLTIAERAPGANDKALGLADLDQEGIWAELVYPSLMLWTSSIRDPELLAAGTRVINDWSIEYQRFSPRLVTAATIPFLSAETAVAEVERAAGLGFHVGS